MKNFSTHKFNLSSIFVHTLLLILLLPLYSIINAQNIPWEKHPSNPVLEPGSPGSWDDEAAGVGCVIFEDNTYKMWYNGYDGTFVRIGYATSPDGITWTKHPDPVLDIGNPGQWDDYWVLIGDVVHVGTVYHMWYTGDDGLVNESGGHATSPDGIVWTRDPDNPVLEPGPAGSWDAGNVGPGYVCFEDDTFHMWYDGYSGGTTWSVGYATATNPYGKNWTKYGNNPILNPSLGSWDYPRIQCGSVAEYLDTLYLFYYGGDFFTWEIGFAKSTDRVNWYKDPNPCLYKGVTGSWEDYYVSEAYVLYAGNEYKMWYWGGNGEYDAKTGLATSPTLPVELTTFTAASQIGKVILNWSTATEINNLGFEIERKILLNENQGEWVRIAFLEGQGTTTEPKEYSYIDDISEINATSLVYRLKQMDFLGTYEYSDEVMIENPAPVDYVLYQNYPNPFNPTTTITFGIPVNTYVVLEVFNAVGEEVAQLYNGEKEAGRYTMKFNAAGLPCGIYFYQLNAGEYNTIKKMILMK